MTLRPIRLAAVLALLSAAPALAQTPPPQDAPPGGPRGGPAGEGRGMGTPREQGQVQDWADRLFSRLDANQDGALTGSEISVLTSGGAGPRGGSRLRAMISQSDADRDARVSREELTAGAQRMFARMDRNGDGRISDDELPQAPPQRPAPVPMPAPAQSTMPTFPEEPSGG